MSSGLSFQSLLLMQFAQALHEDFICTLVAFGTSTRRIRVVLAVNDALSCLLFPLSVIVKYFAFRYLNLRETPPSL